MESGSPVEFNSGTPEKVVALFNKVVKDNEQFLNENQLKSAIDSLFYVSFNIRTVRLLMYFVTSKYDLIIAVLQHKIERLAAKGVYPQVHRDACTMLSVTQSWIVKGNGLKEFTEIYLLLKPLNDVFNSLKEANGLIKPSKAKEGLASMGTTVSDDVFKLLIYNFTKRGSSNTMTFGNFVECGITIEGLKKKYHDEIKKDASNNDFDNFMLNILPYVIS